MFHNEPGLPVCGRERARVYRRAPLVLTSATIHAVRITSGNLAWNGAESSRANFLSDVAIGSNRPIVCTRETSATRIVLVGETRTGREIEEGREREREACARVTPGETVVVPRSPSDFIGDHGSKIKV